jgi:hypothetical protein
MSPEKQHPVQAEPDSANRPQQRREQPGGPRRGDRADARHDPSKLRQNQERLGVGPEHKTEAMKKGRRGTFP